MKRQQSKRRHGRGRLESSNEKASAMTRQQRSSTSACRNETRPDQDLLHRLDEAGKALERLERGELPTPEELAAAPRLDWWCIVEDGIFPVLQGVVTGHPHLHDGAFVGTSPLLWLADDGTSARTLNRLYRLGPRLNETLQRPN